MSGRPIVIGLDFDGTLVKHRWPEIGEDIGAFPHLIKAQSDFVVRYVLWSVRSGPELEAAAKYVRSNGIELWALNHNPTQAEWSKSPKAHCHAYVDDAVIGTPLVYPPIMSAEMRPWVDWDVMGPLLYRRIREFYGNLRGEVSAEKVFYGDDA